MFNKYRFNASIAEFRLKKEQLANYFTADEDIFELIPNQKTNQIFTPKKVVQMMINNLEEHDPSLFIRTDSTFIDLYMKSGMYITEIVKKLFNNTRKEYQSDEDCLKHILEKQVYGLSPTPILQGITQSYIFGFDVEHKITRKNFIQHDITPEAQQGTAKEKLQELLNLKEDMKFDAVVGNPPYQDSKEGGKDLPIYQYFYETSENLSDVYCLISPARFLFDAGATNSDWNKKMLTSEHIKVLQFTRRSYEIFPNTDIKGGVAVLLRDANKELGPIGFFTSFNELDSILKKVKVYNTEDISELIYGVTSYTFTRKLYEELPDAVNRVGEGSGNQMTSSIFEAIPEIFSNSKNSDLDIQIYGRKNNERVLQWVNREYVNLPNNFEKYKVFLPAANGSGEIGEVLSTPIVGDAFIGHTATFISIGKFETKQEAENCLKYLKCKFCRTMLGIKKTTQHNKTKKVWECVPNQNFTQNSDIDWSKSIPEIDQQLYKKYQLSEEEIAFIEEKVQPMD